MQYHLEQHRRQERLVSDARQLDRDGTSHPGTADPGPQDFPLSPSQIADLETAATNGGTHVGDITVKRRRKHARPEKIAGN